MDGRTSQGNEEDEEQKTHLCQHIPISRRDINYERVVRLEDVGSDEQVFGFGWGVLCREEGQFGSDWIRKREKGVDWEGTRGREVRLAFR